MVAMSSPTFTISPSLLDKNKSDDAVWSPVNYGLVDQNYMNSQPTTTASFATPSFTPRNLSPYSHVYSDSASPSVNTPADSWSALSEQFSSDFNDQANPLLTFDFDFNEEPSLPAFLQNSSDAPEDDNGPNNHIDSLESQAEEPGLTLPPSPNSDEFPTRVLFADLHEAAISGSQTSSQHNSQGLQNLQSYASDYEHSQSTPDLGSNSNTTLSSEEDTTSNTALKPSPRVTVSMWEREPSHDRGKLPETVESASIKRAVTMTAGDSFDSNLYQGSYAGKDDPEAWAAGNSARPGGWDPHNRPLDEAASVNELDALRKTAERNGDVDKWITLSSEGQLPPNYPPHPPPPPFTVSDTESDGIDSRDLPLGDRTENKFLPGQIYYVEGNGPLEEDDQNLMRQPRPWTDAPSIHPITKEGAERQQPETSQAAITRFDQMCQDNGSVLSRAATWGTRRRSLPSIADMEGITSGNFLKKLSITRERKPSIILKGVRGLIGKPNGPPKRNLTAPEGEMAGDRDVQVPMQSRSTFQLGSRTGSWTRKPPPSINTALLTITSTATAIPQHTRTGSIGTVTSPKSPFLQVRIPLRRPRSKSELTKAAATDEEPHSNLAELWKRSGGPPVAQLRTRPVVPDFDDDDEDEDDGPDDGDLRSGSSSIIDEITPNIAGFKEQILKMNPSLEEHNTFLVDRIAYQQVARYKALLGNRIKHLNQITSHNCPSRHVCIASGGSTIHYNANGETRAGGSLAMTHENDEGGATQVEGAITAESFPHDIPMPPATSLPAEFECQLCYSTKKFIKPSDWTKHVHEDVQPFTCTWDRCREPKVFKRKADWVRHENEGHRHLEWWTCDVEDCRHTCYRRDNFLQHLVREHKFLEPKVKTKAALKRAGAQDPTWQKVEKCHKETTARPQDEPCRFCGKTLQTWKKLTVHLAKHMEALSLPILRLVAQRELNTDSIISPVQDPPPRTFPPVKQDLQQPFSVSSTLGQSSAAMANVSSAVLDYPNSQQSYTYNTPSNFPTYYDPRMPDLQQSSSVNLGLASGFQSSSAYQELPVTTSSYMTVPQSIEPFPAYFNALDLQTECVTQLYDMSAAETPNTGVEQQQYRSQGSASPYVRSPHQGQGGFFHQQR